MPSAVAVVRGRSCLAERFAETRMTEHELRTQKESLLRRSENDTDGSLQATVRIFQSTVQSRQNIHLKPSCTTRGPPTAPLPRDEVTRPTLVLFTFDTGLLRLTRLNALNISSRTWKLESRPVETPGSRKFFTSERSAFLKPGPRNAFRA